MVTSPFDEELLLTTALGSAVDTPEAAVQVIVGLVVPSKISIEENGMLVWFGY